MVAIVECLAKVTGSVELVNTFRVPPESSRNMSDRPPILDTAESHDSTLTSLLLVPTPDHPGVHDQGNILGQKGLNDEHF